MLSIHSIGSSDASGLASYYGNLASTDDYYTSEAGDKEPAGRWLGAGSETLGLSGMVKDGELLNMMQGFNPATGEKLAANAGDSHKPGWDCTFSAPKSVSAIWAVADRELGQKIELAHRQAIAVSVNYLEDNAVYTRHGQGGEIRKHVEESGGLVAAAYQHSTSRNQDPQLHTHVVVANMAADGRGVDLDTSHKMSAGALYRCELAYQLKELGFEIERDGTSFKIVGVPESLVEMWSSRRAEIENILNEKGVSGAVASKDAALESRQSKTSIDRAVLIAKWEDQAKEHNFTAEKIREMVSPETAAERAAEESLKNQMTKAMGENVKPAFGSMESLKSGAEIVNDLTDKNSTFTGVQALHQVAIDAQGTLSAKETLARSAQTLKESGAIELGIVTRREAKENTDLKSGERFTTQKVLDNEKQMFTSFQKLADKPGFPVDSKLVEQIALKEGLSPQQAKALNHITANNSASVLEGHAGVGKSYLLNSARECWEKSGYEVRGATLANAAAESLKNESKIESTTSIAMLVHQLESGQTQLTNKTILVIDEAGMVGSQLMSNLVTRCEEAGAKIVLVGHTQQLAPIEAGAAMRGVGQQIGRAEVSDVIRQKGIDKEISNDFREGRAGDALKKMDEKGCLHVGKSMHDAKSMAVAGYLADRDSGKSTLLIATSTSEVRQLNDEVRNILKNDGKIEAHGIVAKTDKGYREFTVGDKVIFGARNEFGERGDQSKTVINGTIGIVKNVADCDGKPVMAVQLEKSGATVNVNFQEFAKLDHGHARTIHKAQALTVETTHFVASENSGKELGYVGVSRAKGETHIYTSKDFYNPSKDEKGKDIQTDLEKAMSTSRAKDLATDYVKAKEEVIQKTINESTKVLGGLDLYGFKVVETPQQNMTSNKEAWAVPDSSSLKPVADKSVPDVKPAETKSQENKVEHKER